MSIMKSTQIPLQISLKEKNTFFHFHPPPNQHIVEALKQLCSNNFIPTDERYIYLWGSAQSGRTHLLQACCHLINTSGLLTAYIPGNQAATLTADILNNLEKYDLICIDDIDLLTETTSWEEPLFHLFNKIKDQGTRLIVSATQPPAQLTQILADLQSRLSSGLIFQLKELDDLNKLYALQKRAGHRGLHLSKEAAQFLLTHIPRDLPSLFSALDKLDNASLALQRKLTIPFIKSTLIQPN
jgi:DnaA-homolog protein